MNKKSKSKIGLASLAVIGFMTLGINSAGACNPELPWDTGCAEYDIVVRPGLYYCIEGGAWKCTDPTKD
jgi:hypothetical protein